MNLKTFFSYLAVVAILVTWAISANAQSVLSAEASIFDGISHDCVTQSSVGTSSIWIKETSAEQTFRACSNGMLESLYLNVLESPQHNSLGIQLRDPQGNLMANNRIEIQEGQTGLIKIKMPVLVSEGVEYSIALRGGDCRLKLGAVRLAESDGTFSIGGWNLAGQLEFAVGQTDRNVEEANTGRVDVPNTQTDGSATDNPLADSFVAFPNPFQGELNIEFTKALKGETQIVLSDLSGNMISREVRSNVQWGERVTLSPRYDLLPGVYAVRILNGTNVTNYTVLKN
jgi:methionine-rich copper-binding protein CopC